MKTFIRFLFCSLLIFSLSVSVVAQKVLKRQRINAEEQLTVNGTVIDSITNDGTLAQPSDNALITSKAASDRVRRAEEISRLNDRIASIPFSLAKQKLQGYKNPIILRDDFGLESTIDAKLVQVPNTDTLECHFIGSSALTWIDSVAYYRQYSVDMGLTWHIRPTDTLPFFKADPLGVDEQLWEYYPVYHTQDSITLYYQAATYEAGANAEIYRTYSATSSDGGYSWSTRANLILDTGPYLDSTGVYMGVRSVVFHDSLWYLHYEGNGARSLGPMVRENLQTGVATSPDGINFTDLGYVNVFDPEAHPWETMAQIGYVQLVDSAFVMLYGNNSAGRAEGDPDTGDRYIGIAYSYDGINFTKYAGNPIIDLKKDFEEDWNKTANAFISWAPHPSGKGFMIITRGYTSGSEPWDAGLYFWGDAFEDTRQIYKGNIFVSAEADPALSRKGSQVFPFTNLHTVRDVLDGEKVTVAAGKYTYNGPYGLAQTSSITKEGDNHYTFLGQSKVKFTNVAGSTTPCFSDVVTVFGNGVAQEVIIDAPDTKFIFNKSAGLALVAPIAYYNAETTFKGNMGSVASVGGRSWAFQFGCKEVDLYCPDVYATGGIIYSISDVQNGVNTIQRYHDVRYGKTVSDNVGDISGAFRLQSATKDSFSTFILNAESWTGTGVGGIFTLGTPDGSIAHVDWHVGKANAIGIATPSDGFTMGHANSGASPLIGAPDTASYVRFSGNHWNFKNGPVFSGYFGDAKTFQDVELIHDYKSFTVENGAMFNIYGFTLDSSLYKVDCEYCLAKDGSVAWVFDNTLDPLSRIEFTGHFETQKAGAAAINTRNNLWIPNATFKNDGTVPVISADVPVTVYVGNSFDLNDSPLDPDITFIRISELGGMAAGLWTDNGGSISYANDVQIDGGLTLGDSGSGGGILNYGNFGSIGGNVSIFDSGLSSIFTINGATGAVGIKNPTPNSLYGIDIVGDVNTTGNYKVNGVDVPLHNMYSADGSINQPRTVTLASEDVFKIVGVASDLILNPTDNTATLGDLSAVFLKVDNASEAVVIGDPAANGNNTYISVNDAGSRVDIFANNGAFLNGLNILDNTDSQNLALSANTLSLTGDATPVDLSGYLDNTDAQDLTLSGNTLSLSNDATAVSLSGYLDNTDAQDLQLIAGTLTLSNDPTGVDLSPYLDNTDSQQLTLDGSNNLALTGDATPISLDPFLDNTDNQDLVLSLNILSLTNDPTGVDLTPYMDNTDAQDLTLSGTTLSLTGDATPVDLSNIGSDDLGDHTATQTINTGGNFISGDTDAEGIRISTAGDVGIGIAPANTLHVYENSAGVTTAGVAIQNDGVGDAKVEFEAGGENISVGFDNSANRFKISWDNGLGTNDILQARHMATTYAEWGINTTPIVGTSLAMRNRAANQRYLSLVSSIGSLGFEFVETSTSGHAFRMYDNLGLNKINVGTNEATFFNNGSTFKIGRATGGQGAFNVLGLTGNATIAAFESQTTIANIALAQNTTTGNTGLDGTWIEAIGVNAVLHNKETTGSLGLQAGNFAFNSLEIQADGDVKVHSSVDFICESPIVLHAASNQFIASGVGSPEGNLTAGVGSKYYRRDVGEEWIKETGTGSTGWAKSATE